MRRERRLTRNRDFAAVRAQGRALSDRWLVLVSRPNEKGVSRFGFSVSRRVGNAVVRNRTKRRLREAASRVPVREGWDVVLIARKDAPNVGFQQLSRSVTALIKRAGILENSRELGLSTPNSK